MAGESLIGNLAVNLTMETAAFQKGADYAQKRAEAFGKKMEGLGDKLKMAGAKMTIGITAPLTAFGISSFRAATDAAELQSSFDTTFGKMSASMNKWAEETGNAMGRSTTEMQKAANTFGIFFNTAVDPAKAAEMSKQFSTLAQDLGSFFNTDTETAIEKLRSGLAGESEPLRAFGVFLTEAAVKAKALELGLTGVGGKLTEQEKIQARYALIMEQTTKAQGDVARTASGTANQIRASKAAFEELQIIVGTKLLPALTPLIAKLGEALTWFTNLPAPIRNTALVAAALSAAFGPLLIGLGTIIPLVAKLGPLWTVLATALTAVRVAAIAALPALVPFLVPLGALAVAVGAVYLAWKNWDKIAPIVSKMVGAVSSFLQKLAWPFKWVIDQAKAVGDAFYRLYDRVVGHSYVPDMVAGIATEMAKLDAVMVQPVKKAATKAEEAFRDLQGRLQGLMAELFPQQAQENQFNKDLADLKAYADKAKWSVEQLAEAINRLELARGISKIETATNEVSFEEGITTMPAGFDPSQMKDSIDWTEAWNESLMNVAAKGLSSVRDGLVEVLMGTAKLGEVFRSTIAGMLADLLRFQIQKLMMQGLDAAFGAGTGVALFGGPRALGGPVASNRAYLVGERGPELFMPGVSGNIIPNNRLGAGGTWNINVAAPNTGNPRLDRRTSLQQAADIRRAVGQVSARGIG